MDIDAETTKKIQELQILEQNIQALLMQKQAFEIELNETLNAITEVGKSSDEIYKIIGGVMLKSEKAKISSELNEKKKILELRINSIEKQDLLIQKKSEELKKEINKELSKYHPKSKND